MRENLIVGIEEHNTIQVLCNNRTRRRGTNCASAHTKSAGHRRSARAKSNHIEGVDRTLEGEFSPICPIGKRILQLRHNIRSRTSKQRDVDESEAAVGPSSSETSQDTPTAIFDHAFVDGRPLPLLDEHGEQYDWMTETVADSGGVIRMNDMSEVRSHFSRAALMPPIAAIAHATD